MYSRVTNDIQITVMPEFVPERSDADEATFFWAYTVEIANRGPLTVQLTARHWKITDANGRLEEVRGAGVVGEQPVLKPGETFSLHLRLPADDAVRHHGGHLSDGEREGRYFRRGNPGFFARLALCCAGPELGLRSG